MLRPKKKVCYQLNSGTKKNKKNNIKNNNNNNNNKRKKHSKFNILFVDFFSKQTNQFFFSYFNYYQLRMVLF